MGARSTLPFASGKLTRARSGPSSPCRFLREEANHGSSVEIGPKNIFGFVSPISVDARVTQSVPIWSDTSMENSFVRRREWLLSAFRAIGDNAEMYFFAKDTGGRYLYANPPVLKTLNCSLETLIGKTDETFLTEGSLLRVRDADRRVLEHGDTLDFEETLHVRPDLRIVILQTRKAPIRDESGKIIGLCGLSTDITTHRQLEKSLAERGKLLDAVINGVDTHIYIKDREGRYIFANAHVVKNFQLPVDRIIGRTGHDFLPKEAADHFKELDDRVFSTGVQQTGEEHFTDEDGKVHYFRSTKIPMTLGGGQDVLIGFSTEITETRELKTLLQNEMLTDKLTGLPNRQSFASLTRQALHTAEEKGSALAVIVIGLDRFKIVNDTLGHNAGDLVLIETARRLMSIASEDVAVFRLVGDQFAITLLGKDSESEIDSFARYVLARLASPYIAASTTLFLTASIGVSFSPKDGTSVEDLLKKSETAMFHAKSRGRNTCHFFSSAMEAAVVESMELERDLRLSLGKGEFELHFQPIVAANSGSTKVLEALVRWNRPGHGLVPPSAFIAVAEEIGIIEEIGEWVIDEASRQLAQWQKTVDSSLRVAVNLSARQLQNPDLVGRFLPILERNGVHPEMVELEITESVVMTEPELQIRQLQTLRAYGFSFAIDDFGTGYSSLAYIQKLPVGVLKIDRAFVQDIETENSQSALCRGIIALAHSLQLKTVAEGVETETQARLLTAWGCDYLQGYMYSKPLRGTDIPGYIGSSARDIRTASADEPMGGG